MDKKEIVIDGVKYIPETEARMAQNTEGLPYCIIRTYSAGVHAGYVAKREGKEVTLYNSRRLWMWAGAFTLSEMSMNGVSKPSECKFATAIPEIVLTEAIEIIPCAETARESLEGVPNYET